MTDRFVRVVSGIVFAASLVTLSLSNPAAAECLQLRSGFESMYSRGDIETMRSAYERIAVDPECTHDFREWASRVVANGMVREAQARWSSGSLDEEGIRLLLEASLNYERNWRVLAKLGDIAQGYRDYAAATRYYQEALDLIANESATPVAPPAPIIRHIANRARESWQLTENFVEPTVTRSNLPGGVALRNARGVNFNSIPVPIRFKFGEANFTSFGAEAAETLLKILRREREPSIRLVGHTDPVGSDEANMKLSIARAKAVRDFLVRNGYKSLISVAGNGERSPMRVDDPGRYTEDQLHQMYRRVEVVR